MVPGPEAPLVAGLADAMAAQKIACCGPSAAAAQLEGSKRFTKEIADAAGIPTAAWKAFTEADAAHDYVEAMGAPIVIKADGLAAGKGVVVATTLDEAHEAVTSIMEDKVFGAAGAELVIEQCLVGEEISVFALCDGEDALYLGCAADHKRVGDGDTGPNTGGMGAISPPPWASPAIIDATMARIIRPALARDGPARHAVPRLPVRRPDGRSGRAEADRVQRAFRRPGMRDAAAAAALGPPAGAGGRHRGRTCGMWICAGATPPPPRW